MIVAMFYPLGYNDFSLSLQRRYFMLTKEQFHDLISSGVRFLDGATGSNLQKAGMPRGCCTEKWILENPQALIDLQRRYAVCTLACAL